MGGPGPRGHPDLPLTPPPGPSRHNDLPWQLLKLFNNQLQDPRANLTSLAHTHTNIPKLRAGFVGAQVWSGPEPEALEPNASSPAAPPWWRRTALGP